MGGESAAQGGGADLAEQLRKSRAELEVVKRQAVVYGLYGRKLRSIMVRATLSGCFPQAVLFFPW